MTDITKLALLVSKAKASVFSLEYISQFEPGDIDSDDVDLRFEVDGRDTGTNVSIVDECGQAAKVIGALVEALATMDSEPVAWTWQHLDQWHVTNDEERARDLALDGAKVMPLYHHAQPAPEREQVRREHAEWSQTTFGNVGPIGPLKHLSKEAQEAAAEPGDLSEWADMQFLLWDAQRRAGITDEQMNQVLMENLAVNKLRSWPAPKDGEPRLHIKEQSASVMPNFKKLARELVENLVDCGGLDVGVKGKYLKWTEKTCRAAMLPATPPAPKQENI